MVTPSFYDIFFGNDFDNDTIPELEAAEKEFSAEMDKLAAKYNIPFQDADNVHCANNSEHTAAQYMGFMQGFKWAVYLLTGYKSEGVDKNVLASQS